MGLPSRSREGPGVGQSCTRAHQPTTLINTYVQYIYSILDNDLLPG